MRSSGGSQKWHINTLNKVILVATVERQLEAVGKPNLYHLSFHLTSAKVLMLLAIACRRMLRKRFESSDESSRIEPCC